MARTTATQRRKKRNSSMGYIMVALVVFAISFILILQSIDIRTRKEEYRIQAESLQQQIDEEQARSEEISEYEKYVQTKAYIEQQAQEKLGMIKEGEIIFKKE